ncbi:MAG: hypothetical protein AAGA68_16970 [Pseudomonadota bacterium]
MEHKLTQRAVTPLRGTLARTVAYAFLWSASAPAGVFPAQISVSSLAPENGGDGSTGFVIAPFEPFASLGFPVSTLGDFNGDGVDDVVIGTGLFSTGRRPLTYVLFGNPAGFPARYELGDLRPGSGGDGSEGVILLGARIDENTGGLDRADDLNGDGFADLIIGAANIAQTGQAYIVFGADDYGPLFDLGTLFPALGGDGSRGVVVLGEAQGDDFALDVAYAGDINADGLGDVVVGAPRLSRGGLDDLGAAYVLFGADASLSPLVSARGLREEAGGDGTDGIVLTNVVEDGHAGEFVGGDGCDINADGIDDVVVSTAIQDGGDTFVYFGRQGGFPPSFRLTDLYPGAGGDGSEGFVIDKLPIGFLQGDIACAGDVNADGIDDLLLAQAVASNGDGVGRVIVLFGRSTPFPPRIDLRTLTIAGGGDGSEGVVLFGAAGEVAVSIGAGFTVAGLGDVNGDGVDDFGIGDLLGVPQSPGVAHVVFGRSEGFPAEFALRDLFAANGGDGSRGFVITTPEFDAALASIDSAGDLNADGLSDIIVGAFGANADDGEAYIIYGRSPPELDEDTD